MVMVFSMVPTSVWAEGTQPRAAHTHKVCKGTTACADCAHTDVTYEPLTDVSQLSTTSGNYYLTEDLYLDAQIDIGQGLDIKLCLNGFNIKAKDAATSVRFFNVNRSDIKLTVSNCEAKQNDSNGQHGVLTGAKKCVMFAGNNAANAKIAFYNVIVDNSTGMESNVAKTSTNAVVQMNNNASLEAVGCDFTNNYSDTSGSTIRLYSTGTAKLVGCNLTGNRGRYGYALRADNGSVILTDTVIEGNYSTDATVESGAVQISPEGKNTVNFTVDGQTKIYGNSNKTTADGTGAARDLFLKQATKQPKVKIGAKGLADNAKIGVYLSGADRLVNDPYITDALDGKDYTKNFAANNAGYQIVAESETEGKKLVMREAAAEGHPHKVCKGVANCADCEHTNVTYEPLTDVSKLSTTSGNYYLTEDLVLTSQINIAANLDIKLCLNGFNIRAASGKNIRFFNVNNNNVKLTVSNCGEKKNEAGVQNGVVTGAKDTIMFAGNNSTGSQIAFYNVIFDNNTGVGAAGTGSNSTMQLNSTASLTAVGCDFTNNYSNTAGVVRLYGAGAVDLVGCTLTGNRGKYGYALRADNGSVNLTDTVIENNYSSDSTIDSGAVQISPAGNSTVNFTVNGQTKIQSNSNKTTADGTGVARNLYLKQATKQAKVTVGTLNGEAKIGVTLQAERLTAEDTRYFSNDLADKNPAGFFTSDNDAYVVVRKAGKLFLDSRTNAHEHELCYVANGCACGNQDDLIFSPWGDTDAEKTSLPNRVTTI